MRLKGHRVRLESKSQDSRRENRIQGRTPRSMRRPSNLCWRAGGGLEEPAPPGYSTQRRRQLNPRQIPRATHIDNQEQRLLVAKLQPRSFCFRHDRMPNSSVLAALVGRRGGRDDDEELERVLSLAEQRLLVVVKEDHVLVEARRRFVRTSFWPANILPSSDPGRSAQVGVASKR